MNDYCQYQDPAGCRALVARWREHRDRQVSTFELHLLSAIEVADKKQRAALRKGYPHLLAAYEEAMRG